MGSLDTPAPARGIDVQGDHAYLAIDTGGLYVVDVSIPATPTVTGGIDTPDQAYHVAVDGLFA